MRKFIYFISEKLAPALQKVAMNPYVSALQTALIKTMPMVLVSSLVVIINVIRNYIPALPDLSVLSDYTFGLMSLFVSFLVPYYVCEKKNYNKGKFVAAMTGIALFMIFVNPTIDQTGKYCYDFSCFGAGGMFVAIVAGVYTAFIFSVLKNITVFKEDNALPDFCKEWFDTLLPVAIVILTGWLLVIQCGINLYSVISDLFQPLVGMTNSLAGCIFMELMMTIFYSMGISGWVFTPVQTTMCAVSLAANVAAVAAGGAAEYVFTDMWRNTYLAIGGRGVTFMLVIYCCFSKSKKLKALGKTSFVPNLMNINEPIVFGTIAWNPVLMVPMWISNLAAVIVSYGALKSGLVAIPYENFTMWYLPGIISAIFVSKSVRGIILVLIILAISAIIWYPFFKVYENQCLKEEKADVETEMAAKTNASTANMKSLQ